MTLRLALLLCLALPATSQISKPFFNTDLNNQSTVPVDGHGKAANVNGIRLWDNGVKWGQVNTAPGVYDWSKLDSWVTKAEASGWTVFYTFGDTPKFAAAGIPSGPPCASPGPYSCAPPSDVKADGTGTDKYFQDYAQALVTRYGGRISTIECWNEADYHGFWTGTQAQLVRMCKDLATIVRAAHTNIKLTSPSCHGPTMASWFSAFIKAGGQPTFDYVNVHMRGATNNSLAESFLDMWTLVQTELKKLGMENYPVWDGEWGPLKGEITNGFLNAAFYSRGLILRASVGVDSEYQYFWDGQSSALQNTKAGTAWNVTSGWLNGKSIFPCTIHAPIYTCQLSNGGLIVWNVAKSCSNSQCWTEAYKFPIGSTQWTDLNGDVHQITSGKTIPVGAEPVLLK